MSRRLSGHPENSKLGPAPRLTGGWLAAGSADFTAWSGPWGISYTANLTPDQNTGLGIWTEETFLTAIRTGKHMGKSRPILPPMPWPVYRNMTDDDLKAIFAFLRTLPPITITYPIRSSLRSHRRRQSNRYVRYVGYPTYLTYPTYPLSSLPRTIPWHSCGMPIESRNGRRLRERRPGRGRARRAASPGLRRLETGDWRSGARAPRPVRQGRHR